MSGPSWRRTKLKYLVALKSGDAIDGKDIKDEGDYPVYGGNGLRGYTSGFTHDGDRILIGRQGALCAKVRQLIAAWTHRDSNNKFKEFCVPLRAVALRHLAKLEGRAREDAS